MYIKCWGSRGSIPVSGKEYLRYGGDTTCLEIRTKTNEILIVDAGTGIRRLGNQLIAEGRYCYYFLFTHAHWDHLMGFPFFKPLYSKLSQFFVYRCPFQDKYVETMLSRVMTPPNFPVQYADIKATILYEEACPAPFRIGSLAVEPIALSHPNGGSGYKFTEAGKSMVFLTDNELGFMHPGALSFEDYRAFCSGVDLLIHDAEYMPKEYAKTVSWGHSVYSDATRLACEAKVSRFGLFHHNQERTDPGVDLIVKACQDIIANRGAGIDCFAVASDMVFEL